MSGYSMITLTQLVWRKLKMLAIRVCASIPWKYFMQSRIGGGLILSHQSVLAWNSHNPLIFFAKCQCSIGFNECLDRRKKYSKWDAFPSTLSTLSLLFVQKCCSSCVACTTFYSHFYASLSLYCRKILYLHNVASQLIRR